MCRIEGRCDVFAKNRHPKRSRHGQSKKNQSEATIRDVKRSNNGQSDRKRSKVELEVIEKKQKWFEVKI